MSDQIICGLHGETQATFVCSHMHKAWEEGTPPQMVCQTAIPDDPYPDAWCEACEQEFQAQYETLTNGFSPSAGLVALCTHCYNAMRNAAERAGVLRIL